MSTSLAAIPLGSSATIVSVDGPRAFRRRLLEMGLVPGIDVKVVAIAPFGDPLQIEVRGGQWSIRRGEAARIVVEPAKSAVTKPDTTSSRGGSSADGRPGEPTGGSGSALTRAAARSDSR